MIVVGLTGGIGSGKTTVARMFEKLGVPIYIADAEAKRLMKSSKVIRRKLINLFGDQVYQNNELNRPLIASKIFKETALLERMNAIVHPKVGLDFKRWLKKQNSDYVIKEAAIIFEQNMQSEYDFIITVTAGLEDRMDRLLKRDKSSENKIKNIIDNQMPDDEKTKKSDFVILNNQLKDTQDQVLKIHHQILKILVKI